jgi:hypothetical protein
MPAEDYQMSSQCHPTEEYDRGGAIGAGSLCTCDGEVSEDLLYELEAESSVQHEQRVLAHNLTITLFSWSTIRFP